MLFKTLEASQDMYLLNILSFLFIVNVQLSASYLHPERSNPVYAPMPSMTECNEYVSGFYYNVYLPVERQNKNMPELIEYFKKYLSEEVAIGEDPEFLTSAQLKTLSSYALKYVPVNTLINYRLAPLVAQALKEEKSIDEALDAAQENIQNNDLPKYALVLEHLKRLQDREVVDSAMYRRFSYLIQSVQECITNLDKVLWRAKDSCKREYEDESVDGSCIVMLETYGAVLPSRSSEKEQKLARFENRRKVMAQEIKNIYGKVSQGASFVALQEVTPDAVVELQEELKDMYPTWLSFNNITGKPTELIEEEEVFGESSTFTSTLALSAELKVRRYALAKLPSPSGIHQRMILGVEVLNTKTSRRLTIFTTHTEHLPSSYLDTVMAVHAFVSEFLAEDPDMPFIFGGDLNAFEGVADGVTSGAKFIEELRSGPFEGTVDYREGDKFYVHKTIANSTFIGTETNTGNHKFSNGVLEANALDHILTKNGRVVAGTRSAVVYDAQGVLVDPYIQPELYMSRLLERRTASDHFLNVVIFHDRIN